MCYKTLEVTWPPLTPNCTSLCNGSSYSTHGLNKGLLIKHRWSVSWPTLASSSSTCHLHKSNIKFRFLSLYSISSAYATTNIHHTYFPYTIYQVYDFTIHDTISCTYSHNHYTSPMVHITTPKQSMHTMSCSTPIPTNPRYLGHLTLDTHL